MTVADRPAETHERASVRALRTLQLVLGLGGGAPVSSTLRHDELTVPADEWPAAADILDQRGRTVHMHALAQTA